MITQVLIKQGDVKGKSFFMHTKGTEIGETFSKRAFEASTMVEVQAHIGAIIKEFGMSGAYTIGITVSNKIQVTLKRAA